MTTTRRRSPGRPAIPVERIVTTALQIVDDEGADALSMRALAQRLDSGTATLYRHFSSRADLIARVVDRVFGTVEIDHAKLTAMPWQEACKTASCAMFGALRHHPNVAPLISENALIGPSALAAREVLIAIMLDNAFPPALAARSYATLGRYVLGFAVQLTSPVGDLDDRGLAQAFHDLDPNQFPATVKVAEHLPVPLEVEFEFGLDLIIDGLAQTVARQPQRRSG